MSRASSVELDFFGMEKGSGNSVTSAAAATASKTQFQKLIEQRNNARAVQTAMSIINPQFLKNVITDHGNGKLPENNMEKNQEQLVFNPFFAPQTGNHHHHQTVLPPLPVLNPSFRAAAAANASETSAAANATAPFTIFYNGTVSVFEIPHDKAEMIMKLAQEGSCSKTVESVHTKITSAASTSSNEQQLLDKLNGDLPIARKKSLQRFLMKRKERESCRLTTSGSPYANGSESGVDKKLED